VLPFLHGDTSPSFSSTHKKALQWVDNLGVDDYVPSKVKNVVDRTYFELSHHERIGYTDAFDDLGLPGEMHVTVSLKEVSVGTEVNIYLLASQANDVTLASHCPNGCCWLSGKLNEHPRIAE